MTHINSMREHLAGAMAAASICALACGAATAQQSFQPGQRVEASPFYNQNAYEPCTVVAPVQGGYHVNCDASGEYVVGNAYIRAAAAAVAPAAPAPVMAPAPVAAPAGGGFQAGQRVEASPFYDRNSFEPCTVIAPVQGGYQVNCDRSGEYVVGTNWIRAAANIAAAPPPKPAPVAAAPQPAAPQPAAPQPAAPQPAAPQPGAPQQTAGQWRAGQTVLGSPASIDTGWQRCVVMGGPNANGYYDLDCASWYLNYDGDRVRYTQRQYVDGDWIRADDPGFEPDMQLAAVKAEEAARAAATEAANAAIWDDNAPLPTADVPGGPVRPGAYQCYGGGAGNMAVTFGNGTYSSAGRSGRFTQAGPNITFVDGPLGGFYGYTYAGGDVQIRTAPNAPSSMQCDPR